MTDSEILSNKRFHFSTRRRRFRACLELRRVGHGVAQLLGHGAAREALELDDQDVRAVREAQRLRRLPGALDLTVRGPRSNVGIASATKLRAKYMSRTLNFGAKAQRVHVKFK